jgi:hypothetical protein
MVAPRRIAVLAAALSLALPAGAHAQGAGENQYSDPFEEEQSSSGGGGNSSSGSQSGTGTSGGGELSTTPPDGGTSESQAARTRTPAGELARTGAEPGLIALLGAGFILTGAGLRVRVRRPLA